MTLKTKILEWTASFLIGGAIGGALGYPLSSYIQKRDDEMRRHDVLYDFEITKPDALIPLGDINGDRYHDYVVGDSLEDERGNNKDQGRAFIFLGHTDGNCYSLDTYKLSVDERKKIVESAEGMIKMKRALSEIKAKKNN